MKIQSAITKSIGTAILFAVVSSGQSIQTDYDRGVDFRQYKTYSRQEVQTQDPLWADRIKNVVNAELARKGWTPVESGGDVSIISIEMTHTQRTLNTFYQGLGGGWGWWRGGGGGFGQATTTTEAYKVGTLVVDLFDSKTRKLIWRSSASDTLSDKSDKNIKKLGKGVHKMFEHFPPVL